jgi:hypothetical protein
MNGQKECFKCKTVKPLSDFYKHPMMADGHVNKCKECNKVDNQKNRLEKIEYYREYDRNRANLPHRVELKLEVNRKWRSEDPRRSACHNKVRWAMKNGLLERKPCERCGNEKSLAHHEDYDKPLDVMWLCQPCHKQRHKEIDSERI